MTALTEYGFKPADVEFLLAVQNLEDNPQDYDNTEPGKAPANVTAIRAETSLTKSQVTYRSRDGENGRGFAEDDMGLLRVHPPTVESGTFGPRSVELTDQGRKIVSEIRAARSGAAGGDSGEASPEIGEIERQISDLQEQVENISESLEDIERSRMGAMDSEIADRLSAALRLFPRHQYVLSEILGFDMEALAEVDDLDSIDKDELRRDVLRTLSGDVEGEGDETDHDDLQSVLDK